MAKKKDYERPVLEEAPLDRRPEMYDSLTNNPVADAFRNNTRADSGIFRFTRFIDVEVDVPIADFDPFFFTIIPGVATYTAEHKVKGNRIPLVETYVSTLFEEMVISNATTNKDTFSGTVYNYSLVISGRITIRCYVYEILFKTK